MGGPSHGQWCKPVAERLAFRIPHPELHVEMRRHVRYCHPGFPLPIDREAVPVDVAFGQDSGAPALIGGHF